MTDSVECTMPETVNIVVTCTNRKAHDVSPSLRLRNVGGGTPRQRFDAWVEELTESGAAQVCARDLYQGDHWKVALELPELVEEKGHRARLWVCSAGYGLIPASAHIRPYAATFSPGHRDSVEKTDSNCSIAPSRWWEMLGQWEGPVRETPRSLEQLVVQNPEQPVVLVGSNVYLQAVWIDLIEAIGEVRDPDRFLVICAGASSTPKIEEYLAPADARLQSLVGGAMQSINVRIARLAFDWVTELRFSAEKLRDRLAVELAKQPKRTRYERQQLTDEEVKTFIRQQLEADPTQKKTPLLRILRDREQCACEQGRFSALYGEVKDEQASPQSGLEL